MICVCDGVGGWIRKLVETGYFSREFAGHIKSMYLQKQYKNLKDLLDNASAATKAKGSSTCVMAELRDEDEGKILKTCNLGDSGYWLLRPAAQGNLDVLFKSKTQQHRFNAPF
jgi:serine/threonine protein phosphatase PrpC